MEPLVGSQKVGILPHFVLSEMLAYLGRLEKAREKEKLLFLLQPLAWPIAQR